MWVMLWRPDQPYGDEGYLKTDQTDAHRTGSELTNSIRRLATVWAIGPGTSDQLTHDNYDPMHATYIATMRITQVNSIENKRSTQMWDITDGWTTSSPDLTLHKVANTFKSLMVLIQLIHNMAGLTYQHHRCESWRATHTNDVLKFAVADRNVNLDNHNLSVTETPGDNAVTTDGNVQWKYDEFVRTTSTQTTNEAEDAAKHKQAEANMLQIMEHTTICCSFYQQWRSCDLVIGTCCHIKENDILVF